MLDNMDQDVTKKLKGSDGTAVPVGYDSPKDGNLVLEASKRFLLYSFFIHVGANLRTGQN